MNSKHSILVIFQNPGQRTPEEKNRWTTFVDAASKIKKPSEDILSLGGSSWLIPWKRGLPFLLKILEAGNGLSYKALIIDEHAEWSD